MNRKFNFLLGVVVLSSTCLQAQVILSPDNRSDLLDGMQAVIQNTERPIQTLDEDEFLFYKTSKKEPVEAVAQTTEQVVERAPEIDSSQPVILKDSTALGIISRQFKPLGSMVLGTRGYLQLPGGQTIEKGKSFKAEIKGVSYEVMISDVTEKGYTLQLGSAKLERSFNIQ